MNKLLVFTFLFILTSMAEAARLKDIASIRGVRENQLIGYGLVVGLKGTGDSASEFTSKSFARLIEKMGVQLENKDIASKNVAAVIITATLPAFAKAGNPVDVSVSSIGDATSLVGGTLLQAPLRGGLMRQKVLESGVFGSRSEERLICCYKIMQGQTVGSRRFSWRLRSGESRH